MQTCSKLGIFKPEKILLLSATVHITEPSRFSVTMKHSKWQQAMANEFNAPSENQTWVQLVTDNPNMNLVGCKWVYHN